MSSELTATGLLPSVLLLASVLVFPMCFLLLRLYRRSVTAGMAAQASGRGDASMSVQPGRNAAAPALCFEVLSINASYPQADVRGSTFRRAATGRWRAAAAYAVAGGAYAMVMTLGWLLSSRDEVIVWTKLLVLMWTYFWPALLAVLLVATYERVRRMQLLGAYFTVFAALVVIGMARNADLVASALPLYWLIVNGPPTVLLAMCLARPIRAVGPLVLAFLIAAVAGSQLLVSAASTSDALLRVFVEIGFAIGLGAAGVLAGMMLVGAVLFAWIGWRVLRHLGVRYEARKLSDQSLMLDALWLLFGVVQSISLATQGTLWILTGVLGFAAYKIVAALALRRFVGTTSRNDRKTLMLLRVFALAKRSEQLFDKLRKHWQYVGSISMIAGPDLVTTTVEPHEFLDFVSGRLSRQFVSDEADLQRRVAAIEGAPDPDGRHRINEFFCRDNTWQTTMATLAVTSDAVLMDLRSFSPANQGCVFELGRLVDAVDFHRVVFLIDDSTDVEFLEATLRDLWQAMNFDSPNRTRTGAPARLFRIAAQSERELSYLLGLLIAPDNAPAPSLSTA